MENKESNNLGENIKDIVQSAVNGMDFQRLNHDISLTVNEAIREIRQGIVGSMNGINSINTGEQNKNRLKEQNDHQKKEYNQPKTDNRSYKNHQSYQWKPNQVIQYHYQRPQAVPSEKTSYLVKKPVGQASGILMIVFGSMGVLGGSALMLVSSLAFMTQLLTWEFALLFRQGTGFFTLGSALMLAFGISKTKRLARYKKYVKALRGKNWCEIKEIVAAARIEERIVRRDIKKMIKKRIFPQGRLDEEGTCLMLDNQSYQQYLDAKEAMLLRQKKEEEEQNVLKENPDFARVAETLEEGQEYIRKIRKANDEIPGVEISDKLYALEAILEKIFGHLKWNPDKLSEMRRFMNYYLPTTLKLVEAYRDLDKQDIAGANIIAAKKEIQDTLDTINEAFVKLFDSLFAERAMDISADISVLQTMFAQEGLTKPDF